MLDKYLVVGCLGVIGSIFLAVLGHYFIGLSPNIVSACSVLFALGVIGLIFHESFQRPMKTPIQPKNYIR